MSGNRSPVFPVFTTEMTGSIKYVIYVCFQQVGISLSGMVSGFLVLSKEFKPQLHRIFARFINNKICFKLFFLRVLTFLYPLTKELL